MTRDRYKDIVQLVDIEEPSIIRHKVTKEVWIVTANYGDRLTAVRTMDVRNKAEWEVLCGERL